MSDADSLFHEEQILGPPSIRLLLAVPPSILFLLLIWQVVLGHPWGRHPMPNASLIGWTIFLWLVYLRLISIRLITELGPGELAVALRGFWRTRRVPVTDIKSVEVITFNPLRHFGGYGIRTTRKGKAYLASGNQ